MLLKEFEGEQQIHHVHIIEVLFWIWVHGLPHMARNECLGRMIGSSLGRVEEVNMDNNEVIWGEFMWIHIIIDISKPLMSKKRIKIGNSEFFWVQFSYECLPNFCYCCGSIGHGHQDCEKWKLSKENFVCPMVTRWGHNYLGIEVVRPSSRGGRQSLGILHHRLA